MLNKLDSLRSASVSEEGFTLIELIIVVVIIGILAAIAIPMFLNQQKGAIQAGVKSDVRNANTSVATALVKKPTAKYIMGTVNNTGGDITVDASAAGTNKISDLKVSDSGTILTVGSPASVATGTLAAGAWNNYGIRGANLDAGEGTASYTYTFDSTTGKSVEGTSTPTPPVIP